MSDESTRDLPATPRVAGLSDAKRALLARRMAARAAAGPASIPARPKADRAPLSHAQEEAWLLEQRSPGLTAYNLANAWRVRGAFDEDAFGRAINQLVARHESLRTTFHFAGKDPEQHIGEARPVVVRIANAAESASESAGRETLQRWARETFDLTQDLMLRAGIVRLGPDDRLLFMMMHHLAVDAPSIRILYEELAQLYAQQVSGANASLPAVSVPYGDFAVWQRSAEQQTRLEGELTRWKERLRDAPDTLDLLTDYPRGTSISHAGDTRATTLPPDVLAHVRELAQRHECTMFMVLFAAFSSLLARYAGQDELTIGVPVAGRRRPELQRAVGFFTNTLALRADVSGDPTFAELLRRARSRILDAFDDEEAPFGRVAEMLRANGRPAHAPLFQVMFALQEQGSSLSLPGLNLEPLAVTAGASKFDLTLLASERAEGLRLAIEFRTDLFDGQSIERMVGHLARLIRSAVANPESKLSGLTLMDDAERVQVLATWNDTARPYPDVTLLTLLEQQAHKTPDAIALTFENVSLTYAQLHERAEHWAAALRANGAQRNTLIGVCSERSVELVVALLAVLKSGGAYVPLDPDYPAERLSFMLEDSAPAVVLTTHALAERVEAFKGPVLFLDDRASGQQDQHEDTGLSPSDAAYMIYTSGSTGRPKGALNAHSGIVNRLLWMQEQYGLTEADTVLQKTPYSFDVSVWEFFWPLITGARLVVARPGGHRDPAYLAELIERERVTVCHFVPSMLGAFLNSRAPGGEEGLSSLRAIMASGEALTPDLVAGVRNNIPTAALHNLYGPTECAVDVTHWTCSEADCATGARVPIGRPVANTQLYVLDVAGNPLPAGLPGELFLAGAQVGMGYHGRPELTAERFVPDPFASDPAARMYRTGDRARWRGDGVVEYLGRLDSQVKLRGFRIELGEIEETLTKHPAVERAAVIVRSERGGELVGYVVPENTAAGPLRRLATLAEQNVPLARYELPNGFSIFHRNRGETDFLYRKFLSHDSALQKNISIANGDVIFDVGANIGLSSVLANTYADAAMVYAFEPVPPLFEVLQLNLQVHSPRGRAFPYGLGRANEHISLTFDSDSGKWAKAGLGGAAQSNSTSRDEGTLSSGPGPENASTSSAKTDVYSCEIRTISRVLRDEGIERVDLLRIDVEKFGWDILLGVHEADWARIRQVVIEVRDLDGRLQQVVDFFRERGFSCDTVNDDALSGAPAFVVYAQKSPVRAEPDSAKRAVSWHGQRALQTELQRYLSRHLPEYMVPSAIVFLDALPLTSSGKLDRRALSAPSTGADTEQEYVAPRTPLEMQIARVWEAVLGRERVGADDDFFALGGHSLLALRLVAGIATATGIRLPVSSIWQARNVRALAELLVEHHTAGTTPADAHAERIVSREDSGPAPLTSAQELLWLYEQMSPGTAAYHIPIARRVRGPLHRSALREAFEIIVQRHESLRTRFVEVAGAPGQIADAGTPVHLEEFDLSGLGESARDGETHRLLRELAQRPIDLAASTQPKVALITLGMDDAILLFVVHHIVFDGMSAVVMVRELTMAYEALVRGTKPNFSPLPIQFADFATWERRALSGPDMEPSLAFWRSEFEGVRTAVELPMDFARPPGAVGPGARYVQLLPVETRDAVRAMARAHNATVFTTMMAGVQTLLHRYTGETDVVVGSAVEGRERAETAGIVGYLAQTIALRARFDSDPTFAELLSQVQKRTLQALEHQHVPYEALVRELRAEKSSAEQALFHVVLTVQDSSVTMPRLGSAAFEPVGIDVGAPKFDVTFSVTDLPEGIRIVADYRSDLYSEATVARFIGHLQELMMCAARNPGTRVSQLSLMTDAERALVLSPPPNCTAYILDKQQQPLPIGIPGEVYIGGFTVSEGRSDREGAIDGHFMPDPFSAREGRRMFRSGERGRRLASGEIQLVGRSHAAVPQVGHRLDFSQTESVLAKYPWVKQAVVTARPDDGGQVVAYVVLAADGDGTPPTRDELRIHLSRHLPVHLVPTVIVFLGALPLTDAGEVDRDALPAPTLATSSDFEPPSGPVEEVIASIFKQALQVEHVGRSTSFFELGGHSLLVTRVVAALAKVLRVQVPLRTMFDAPTIRGLAEAVVAREAAPGQAARIAEIVMKVQGKTPAPKHARNTPTDA